MPLPVDSWPSGFVIVASHAPAVAVVVFRSSCTVVGLTKAAELTVMPQVAAACRRLAKPAPGSKKPLPFEETPVIVTAVEADPRATRDGVADVTLAGAGARNRTTRVPQTFVDELYSWMVHSVMSSSGSTVVIEKSPQRRRPFLAPVSLGGL